MEPFYRDRPLNFAHRGASAEAPANTLSAFLRAAEVGADGVELDAQMSKDGHVVVIHDFGVDATTDGHGAVCEKTLAELRALDAGGRFSPAFAGEPIPTLQEVVDAVGRRLLLNIELKVRGAHDDGLAAAVVRIIEDNHLIDRVIVSSFSRLAIRRVRRLNPHIPIGLLYYFDPLLVRRPWPLAQAQPEALHPWYRIMDDGYMRWAKARGFRVHTWTVDSPDQMRRLIDQGADIIITNHPDRLRDMLRSA